MSKLMKACIAAILSMLVIASLVGAAPGDNGGESIHSVPQQVTQLQAEVAELTAVVATLSEALTTESAARVALEDALAAEQAARAHADDLLAYNLTTESTLRANADAQLQADLASETAARSTGDSATLAAAMAYANDLLNAAPQPMTEGEIRAAVTDMWPACTPATANGWQCLPGLADLQFAFGAAPVEPGQVISIAGQVFAANYSGPLAYAGMPLGIYVSGGSVDPQIVVTDSQGRFHVTYTAPAEPMRVDVKVISALNTRTTMLSVYGEPVQATFGFNHVPSGIRGRVMASDANHSRVPHVTIHYTTSAGLAGTDTTDHNGFGTIFIDVPYGESITLTLDGAPHSQTYVATPPQ
jgi:hypothetical protein